MEMKKNWERGSPVSHLLWEIKKKTGESLTKPFMNIVLDEHLQDEDNVPG